MAHHDPLDRAATSPASEPAPPASSDRRTFVRRSVAIGIGGALFPAWGVERTAEVAADTPSAPSPRADVAQAFALDEATVADLQGAMASGKHTARSLAEQYLTRIETLDRGGPAVNSVIELNPDALAIADFLDAERKAKGARSPLHGIPVLIKDNIDTADRMKTSAGSLALAASRAPRDAEIVRRLRDAGAVIIGKTNLSEWANWRSTRASSGWSARGGLTRNPYALDRNTSGSSSGTGASISANFATVGVGTETDGSIVSPAGVNGLVGIKPTVGLVSRAGIIPISRSQDTAGPMCRTVRDAAALLTVMAGLDPRDGATQGAVGRVHADYTTFCTPGGLKGARIGVVRALFNAGPAVDAVMEEALAALKHAGAILIDPLPVPTIGKFGDAEFDVLLHESKTDIEAYLATLGPSFPYRTLADLIRFNEENKATSMPYFGQEIFLQAAKKGPLTSPAYRKALASCRTMTRAQGIDLAVGKHRLDALVAPTNAPAWTTDLVNGDHFVGGSSSLAAVSGYPSVTVPAGMIFGLPVGLSFIGAAWTEGKLIRLAHAFETETRARRSPTFLATIELPARQR